MIIQKNTLSHSVFHGSKKEIAYHLRKYYWKYEIMQKFMHEEHKSEVMKDITVQ